MISGDQDTVEEGQQNNVILPQTEDSLIPADEAHKLDPPLSAGENMRDALLQILDSTFFQYLGIVVLIGVVASGAVFFFFLMGWQTLCRPRTDCNPRNDIYNVAIQFLNVFFTYMATVSMPWRCTNFLHTTGWSCPYRENAPGHDLFGQVTDDVWFHVSLRKRIVILLFLLLNCVSQYANQVTRIVYYNYDLQNEFPGNMWTNIFFGLSMICAAIGGSLMGYHTGKVRATDPERFGLGPVELVRDMYHKIFHREGPSERENDAPGAEPHRTRASEAVESEFDPTRAPSRRSVIDVNRSSLRMFAL